MSIKYNEFGEVISVNGLVTGQHLGSPTQDALGGPNENCAYCEELGTITSCGNTIDDKQPTPPGGGSGGGGKLYRHDIHINEYWIGLNDIWLTIYNSDPTNYSAKAVFTEEDENGEYIYDYTEPLTAEDFAFLPESPILASGCIDTSGGGSSEYIVTAIEYDPERGIWVYGIYCGDDGIGTVQTDWVWEFKMTSAIKDTVTEITL